MVVHSRITAERVVHNLIEGRPGQLVRVRLNGRAPGRLEGAKLLHRYRNPAALVLELEQGQATLSLQ